GLSFPRAGNGMLFPARELKNPLLFRLRVIPDPDQSSATYRPKDRGRKIERIRVMSIVTCLIPTSAGWLFQVLLGLIIVLTYPLSVTGAEISGKPEKAEVTVAYVSPSAAFTPLYVAAEAGLFAKYG